MRKSETGNDLKVGHLPEGKKEFYLLASIPHWSRVAPRGVDFPKFLGLLKHLCQEDSSHPIREGWGGN